MRTQKQTAAGPRLGLSLLVALIGVPLLEIALFIEVGSWIGLGPTLALIVLTAVIGAWLLRWQGIGVLLRAQRQLADGVLPVAEVFEGLCVVIGGALLLVPGFFTDAVGALLLVPAVRRGLYRQVRRRIEPHIVRDPDDFAAGPDHGPPSGPTIEAEFEEVGEDRPGWSGNGGDLPPPRGDWGRRP
ncbi:MAG: FxsA family protein [Geminicoccaceae bacterium]